MTLRDYQQEAVEFLLPRRRAFIVSPAGSGKTIIAAAAVARKAWPGCKIGWLANTREQVDQAIAAISRTPGPEGCTFSVDCAAACPDYSNSDIIVIDEGHHSPAAGTWLPTIKACKGIIWGFSATPFHDSDENRNKCVRELFQEFFSVDRERILASGHLVPGKVVFHDLDIPGQFDREIEQRVSVEVIRRCRVFPRVPRHEHLRRVTWQFTQEALKNNEARNQAAIQIAKSEAASGRSVLVLVHTVEHGERLIGSIPEAAFIHAGVGAKNRRTAIDRFRRGEIYVLGATSLADEGLDCPRAASLVLVSGGRSSGKTEQRAGRVLRTFEGKEVGICHDFLDRGACYAAAQARARWRTYEKLGYEISVKNYLSTTQASS